MIFVVMDDLFFVICAVVLEWLSGACYAAAQGALASAARRLRSRSRAPSTYLRHASGSFINDRDASGCGVSRIPHAAPSSVRKLRSKSATAFGYSRLRVNRNPSADTAVKLSA